jgi:hypothetical protein
MSSALPAPNYNLIKDFRAPGDDRWRLGDPPSVPLIDNPLNDTLRELQEKLLSLEENISLIHPEKVSFLTENMSSFIKQLDRMAVESGLMFPRVASFNHSLIDKLGEFQENIAFLKDNTSLVLPEKMLSLTANIFSLSRQLELRASESGLLFPRVACFMTLPLELRQKIWRFAIQAPQNIKAQFKYSIPRNPSYRDLVLLSAYCPLSQVNREAREEVLLYLGQHQRRRESIGKPNLPAMVANFNIDLLWWIDMDDWEIPEALTPLITAEAMNGKEIHSRRIRRIATPYRPWRDILSGSKLFRVMEVFHNLGIEEVILVYTRFEEGTKLENFNVKLVPPRENKLEVLMRFFQDNHNAWSGEGNKRSAVQLGDAHHDHVVIVQRRALREIERLRAQGNGMYYVKA